MDYCSAGGVGFAHRMCGGTQGLAVDKDADRVRCCQVNHPDIKVRQCDLAITQLKNC